MADINEVNGVFGGIEFEGTTENVVNNGNAENNFATIDSNINSKKKNKKLPVKAGFWSNFKAFWLQDIKWDYEIKVELTPYQQKVEDEINEFLHQEITWEKVHDFLFQEVSFGSKAK